jgi:L-lactate dehydrogenase (cytochrome)
MKPSEIRSLVSLAPSRGSAVDRRLRRCHGIGDMREIARRRTPQAVFDYVEGGADEELSLIRNVQAFRQWELMPEVARDVSVTDTSTSLFGRRIALPLACAPTGYTRMLHPDGELAVARAAASAQVPYGLSTVASTSIEDVAATGHPNLWFQLYVWRDRGLAHELVDRAWAAGYRVLEVSVDVPVSGYRIRDVRNGMTIPPRLNAGALAGIVRRPHYWIGALSRPAITFANLSQGVGTSGGVTIENMSAQFDPALTWDDVARLRDRWPGALLVKGPLGPEGALAALAAGADGLHLSTHGGRQLDRAVPPVEVLPDVREAVGEEAAIIVDSGVRHGTDIAVAVGLGADAAAIGRAYLYGLMAAGQVGVERALALLAAEFRRTLQLLGVASVAELRAGGSRFLRHVPGVAAVSRPRG